MEDVDAQVVFFGVDDVPRACDVCPDHVGCPREHTVDPGGAWLHSPIAA